MNEKSLSTQEIHIRANVRLIEAENEMLKKQVELLAKELDDKQFELEEVKSNECDLNTTDFINKMLTIKHDMLVVQKKILETEVDDLRQIISSLQ